MRDIGGYMVALRWSMENIYGVKPGETFWTASDIGWVVGHSYIVYGPLLYGCSAVLYEGKPVGTPDAGAFWRVISEYKVSAFFTAPTALRAVRKEDPEAKFIAQYDLSSLRTLFLAGERADPDTVAWAETGDGQADHRPLVADRDRLGRSPPIRSGSASCRSSAARRRWRCRAIRSTSSTRSCKPVPAERDGLHRHQAAAAAGLPADAVAAGRAHAVESYLAEFPGYYKTSDAGLKDEDGYLTILGRTDDIINVAGHRLSTGGMEEVVALASRCRRMRRARRQGRDQGRAALRLPGAEGGRDAPATRRSRRRSSALVRDKIGPVAAFKLAIVVARLPKTRSGKILRGTMKKIADHEAWTTPATIEDPAALEEVTAAIRAREI